MAWRSGHYALVIQDVWFFFTPNGIGIAEEDGIIEKLLESTDFRIVRVELDKQGLCPRCRHTLPFKWERPWRKGQHGVPSLARRLGVR